MWEIKYISLKKGDKAGDRLEMPWKYYELNYFDINIKLENDFIMQLVYLYPIKMQNDLKKDVNKRTEK